jgi:CHAT domain
LSLSRAFLYAGSDGIISTLWKTEDKVTSFLMQRLHHHLNNQVPVSKALQMAKQDLLHDQSIGSQFKTPNYWANFIYVGKLESSVEDRFSWKNIIFAGALFVGFLFFLKKYKGKISSNN